MRIAGLILIGLERVNHINDYNIYKYFTVAICKCIINLHLHIFNGHDTGYKFSLIKIAMNVNLIKRI